MRLIPLIVFIATGLIGTAQCDDTAVLINLQTGFFADEIDFTITDENSNEVFVFSDSAASVFVQNNEYYSFNLCLPAGCYAVYMYDSFGDGWNGATLTVSYAQMMIPLGGLENGSFGATSFGVFNDECNPEIFGCTDPNALNYQPWATADNNTCEYPFSCEDGTAATLYICTFSNAANVALDLVTLDGTVIESLSGLNNGTIAHFEVCLPDDECLLAIMSNTEGPFGWYNGYFWVSANGSQVVSGALANGQQSETLSFALGQGACPTIGCTDESALNYDSSAEIDDDSCIFPIDCGSLTPVQFAMETQSFGQEVFWTLLDTSGLEVASGGNYQSFATYTEETCLIDGCYLLNMFDEWGDGWGVGATLTVSVPGQAAQTFELAFGAEGQAVLAVNSDCTEFEIPVEGCTDAEALNYDPNANTDDGSCQYPFDCSELEMTGVTVTMLTANWGPEISWTLSNENQMVVANGDGFADFEAYEMNLCLPEGCYFLTMNDSFGDGWNGASLTFSMAGQPEQVFTLNTGSQGQGVVSVNADCSEFEPPVQGCTDASAVNYNPEATLDDGSCITPAENDLCENALELVQGIQLVNNSGAFQNVGIWGECWNSGTGEGEQTSVWYSFTTPDEPASIFLQTFGDGTNTLTDTQFGLFDECGGTMIACDGNGGPGLFSAFFFSCGELEAATTYYLMIDGWFGDSGTCYLNYEVDICGPIEGCTDPEALNYDPLAELDNGSCTYPINCDELTTVTAIMETNIFGFEISWVLTDENQQIVMSGGDYSNSGTFITEACLEEGCYYLSMFDSFGDGWNGATLTFITDDGSAFMFDLPQGSFGQGVLAVGSDCGNSEPVINGCTDPEALNYNSNATNDDESCTYALDCEGLNPVVISLTTAMWGDEISWVLLNENGAIVAEGAGYENNSAYTIEFCLEDGCYTLEMYDSFGDGWNGAVMTVGYGENFMVTTYTLAQGSFDTASIGINSECDDFEPEPIFGCTDATAANYNPDATIDDGSCNYEPVDCDDNLFIATFYTEIWANEVSWELLDANGTAVLVSAPYANNQAVTQTACLTDGCYTLNLYDSFGDGWNSGALTINYNGNELIVTLPSGSFSSTTIGINATGCGEIVGCTDPEALNFNPNATSGDDDLCVYYLFEGPGMNDLYLPMNFLLYPNPSIEDVIIDVFDVDANETLSLQVFDMQGRIVFTRDFGYDQHHIRFQLPASELATGVYMVNVVNGTQSATKRMIRQ